MSEVPKRLFLTRVKIAYALTEDRVHLEELFCNIVNRRWGLGRRKELGLTLGGENGVESTPWRLTLTGYCILGAGSFCFSYQSKQVRTGAPAWTWTCRAGPGPGSGSRGPGPDLEQCILN